MGRPQPQLAKKRNHRTILRNRDPNKQHFATDHLLTNLKGRTVSSGFVTLFVQSAKLILNPVSIMALARVLTPQHFGLVAMVTTIIGFLRIFNHAGLSTATVQREGNHARPGFQIFLVERRSRGEGIGLLLALLSRAIACFDRDPHRKHPPGFVNTPPAFHYLSTVVSGRAHVMGLR